MKKAIIDLGTNTFNLLIAEVGSTEFNVIYANRIAVSIGQGGINNGLITEEAIARALNALATFKQVCETNQVSSIRAIGTSAIRDAKNNIEFCELVELETGIIIEIIDGHKEANLIYKGVLWSHEFKEPAVIMDIGGGSTEFIFADQSGVVDLISLNIGVARIADLKNFSDPLTASEVAEIEAWLDKHSTTFFDDKLSLKLIGASGSFETFYELLKEQAFPKAIAAYELPFKPLLGLLDKLIFSTENERNNNKWISKIRKKMVPIASVKVRWIINKLNVNEVYVSSCSLKEGALMD